MMKRHTVRIAALLIAIALLAACAPTPSHAPGPAGADPSVNAQQSIATPVDAGASGIRAMGRYVEEALALPEGAKLRGVKRVGDTYYGIADATTLYTSTDMAAWASGETGLGNEYEQNGILKDFALGEDGAFYLLYSEVNMQDFSAKSRLMRCLDGEVSEIPFESPRGIKVTDPEGNEYVEMYPENLYVLSTGEFLLNTNREGIFRFSPEGRVVSSYAVQDVQGLATHGDELAVYLRSAGVVRVYSISSGEVLRELPVDSRIVPTLLGYDSQGALHYATGAGIFRSTPGGALWERIVDGSLCSLSKPTSTPNSLVFTPQDEPLIYFNEHGGKPNLLAYRYDAGVATEPYVALNVYALYNSEYLKQAAFLFQNRFPDAMVKINVALTGDSSVTRDDAIRTLNTEVLAGKGPDVLVLDGLPMDSYVEKGVLTDLSGIVNPLLGDGSLYENVVKTFAQGDAIPAIPLRFNIPSIWGDVDGLKTLDDVVAWVKAHPNLPPFFDMAPKAMIERFLLSCLPAWTDEKGLLKQEPVEAFLAALKAMRDPWESRDAEVEEFHVISGVIPEVGWNPYAGTARDPIRSMEDPNGCMLMASDQVGMVSTVLRGPITMLYPYGAIDQAGKGGGFALMPGQAQNVFLPSIVVGVNAKSANLDLAKEFIKLALEEDLQTTDTQDGFPVHSGALTWQMAEDEAKASWAMGRGEDLVVFTQWPDAAMREELKALIPTLNTPISVDLMIYDVLIQESEKFFAGEMDAGQAAANVVSRANGYLSE